MHTGLERGVIIHAYSPKDPLCVGVGHREAL